MQTELGSNNNFQSELVQFSWGKRSIVVVVVVVVECSSTDEIDCLHHE